MFFLREQNFKSQIIILNPDPDPANEYGYGSACLETRKYNSKATLILLLSSLWGSDIPGLPGMTWCYYSCQVLSIGENDVGGPIIGMGSAWLPRHISYLNMFTYDISKK